MVILSMMFINSTNDPFHIVYLIKWFFAQITPHSNAKPLWSIKSIIIKPFKLFRNSFLSTFIDRGLHLWHWIISRRMSIWLMWKTDNNASNDREFVNQISSRYLQSQCQCQNDKAFSCKIISYIFSGNSHSDLKCQVRSEPN